MDNDLLAVLSANSNQPSAANANSAGVTGASSSQRREMPANPVMEALTERLLQQSQGISSSASSQLQDTITEAISGVEKSGDLTSQRLQSERAREVDFARGRAGATYTTALEGRSGYATQVAAMRELTETTEKSVRDLDQRYQEAVMANDANTAGQVAQLRMQKLQFQVEQEQNFFTNLMSAANLQQSAIDSMMRNDQFWATQEQNERQFVMQMAQSSYQFQKNLAVQYKELDLKGQELDIQRERNNLSRAEFNLRKEEIEKAKSNTTIEAIIKDRMIKQLQGGVDLGAMDDMTLTTQMYSELITLMPQAEIDADDFAAMVVRSKSEAISEIGFTAPPSSIRGQGGLFGEGGYSTNLGRGASTAGSLIGEGLFGVQPGQQSTASQIDWDAFAKTLAGKAAFGAFY